MLNSPEISRAEINKSQDKQGKGRLVKLAKAFSKITPRVSLAALTIACSMPSSGYAEEVGDASKSLAGEPITTPYFPPEPDPTLTPSPSSKIRFKDFENYFPPIPKPKVSKPEEEVASTTISIKQEEPTTDEPSQGQDARLISQELLSGLLEGIGGETNILDLKDKYWGNSVIDRENDSVLTKLETLIAVAEDGQKEGIVDFREEFPSVSLSLVRIPLPEGEGLVQAITIVGKVAETTEGEQDKFLTAYSYRQNNRIGRLYWRVLTSNQLVNIANGLNLFSFSQKPGGEIKMEYLNQSWDVIRVDKELLALVEQEQELVIQRDRREMLSIRDNQIDRIVKELGDQYGVAIVIVYDDFQAKDPEVNSFYHQIGKHLHQFDFVATALEDVEVTRNLSDFLGYRTNCQFWNAEKLRRLSYNRSTIDRVMRHELIHNQQAANDPNLAENVRKFIAVNIFYRALIEGRAEKFGAQVGGDSYNFYRRIYNEAESWAKANGFQEQFERVSMGSFEELEEFLGIYDTDTGERHQDRLRRVCLEEGVDDRVEYKCQILE